jgi:predicted phage-related endonuclease
MGLIQDVQNYLTIDEQIKQLERQKKELKQTIEETIGQGTVDLTINQQTIRIQQKTRTNKRCDLTTLETEYPQIYQDLVTESQTTYTEIKKVNR